MKKLLLSTLTAASLLANDSELQTLKAQLEQMSKMMKEMQEKIDRLEHADTPEPAGVHTSQHHLSSEPHTSHAEHESSLLDISLNLDASYVSRSKRDEELTHLELPGIAHGLIGSDSHAGHDHTPYNASNGFNLNYAEMLFHGTLNPSLDADAVFHFTEEGVEIEEAYITRTNLPYNFRVRGGKFLSEFGRLNNQHHHEWSFSDMPLVYEAFLGLHGINEIGAQLQWVAPTSHYLMFGFEALQGKNEAMFGQTAIHNPYTGQEEEVLSASANQPSLYVGYVKTAADIGNTTILAGASIAHGNSRQDHFADETPYAFSGKSDLYGMDLTLIHRFDNDRSVMWQSEWLYRNKKGTHISDSDNDLLTPDELVYSSMDAQQAGYYSQLIYAPAQSWKIGARYDNIYQNELLINDVNQNMPENMNQYSAMIEYSTSESARYRLQYTHSNALFNEEGIRQNLDSLIFSFNITLGEHSDHEF